MSQAPSWDPVEASVGYALKQAQSALHQAMDEALRPLGLTVAQYVCLELLGRSPGLTNAGLARSAFVTRQSMNLVLRGLQRRGLLSRPAVAQRGRALPSRLTRDGARALRDATEAVRVVEERMLAPLGAASRASLRECLAACAAALTG